MKTPSFENPLIPHARMRALYRALVETRLLSASLSPRAAVRPGLEACWVSAALDLRPADYALDALGGRSLEHIRLIATRSGTQSPTRAAVTRSLLDPPPFFSGTAAERLLCAAGAALAAQSTAQSAAQSAVSESAVLAFAGHDELTAAEWARVLTLAAAAELPLLLLAVPGPRPRRAKTPAPRIDLERLVSRLPRPQGYVPLPVIPVDAGDTIALYRVVQESLVRARAGGGAVVIDCIDMGVDPITLLGTQLVERRIATRAWVAGVAPAISKLLPA